jgi:hypothetical protein
MDSTSPGLTTKQCEFTVARLARNNTEKHSKVSSASPRAAVLAGQIRSLEEKHKADLAILEDVQAFVKARGALEMEYASNLQKLAQQFHNKRKWPAFAYSKGHENILVIDLWRSVINLGMEDAKAHAIGSEQLSVLAGEIFEKGKAEKKIASTMSTQMLVNLQEDLVKLDQSVAETKAKYIESRKAYMKKTEKKSKATVAEVKKAESSWQFARHEYILETAAANEQYLLFRNHQLPEVMDSASTPTFRFVSNFFKAYAGSLGLSLQTCGKNMKKVDKLASKLGANFEQRIFLHEYVLHFWEEGWGGDWCQQLSIAREDALGSYMSAWGYSVIATAFVNDRRVLFPPLRLPVNRSLFFTPHRLLTTPQPKKYCCYRHRREFPGRQMFEVEPHPDDVQTHDLVVDGNSRHTLLKIRELLKHTVKMIDSALEQKEQELHALLELHDNYQKAGGLVDQTQRSVLLQKMSTLHVEIEAETTKTRQLQAKISRITDAGVDNDAPEEVQSTPDQDHLYLDQAQAHELARREEDVSTLPAAATRALKELNASSAGSASTKKSSTKQAPPTPRVAAAPAAPAAADKKQMQPEQQQQQQPPMYMNAAEADGVATAATVADDLDFLPPPPEDEDADMLHNSFDETNDTPPPPPEAETPGTTHPAHNQSTNFDQLDDGTNELPPPPPALNESESFYENVVSTLGGVQLSTGYGDQSGVLSADGFYVNTTEGIYEELCEAEVPLFYRALYDYTAAQADDLSIQAEDMLYVLVAREDGWCQGLSTNGKLGFFPQSYVEKIQDQSEVTMEVPRIIRLTPSPAEHLKLELRAGSPPMVVEVAPGSVVAKEGVKVGDYLLEVDEEPCASASYGQVSSWLQQCESGRTLKLCIVTIGGSASVKRNSSSA